jgi:sulfide:quinone oxidoreductase
VPATEQDTGARRDHARPLRVLVAGGGFAALELLAALAAHASGRVTTTLVAPQSRAAYRPASVGAPFGAAVVRDIDVARVAADHGGTLRVDAVEAVRPAVREVRLASGGTLSYDALVLAAGARRRTALPGALTFRDEQDAPLVRGVLDRAEAGDVRSIVVVVPTGTTWPVPAYELALHAARWRAEHAPHLRLTLVTTEPAPLAVVGREGSAVVRTVLADAGVGLLTGAAPRFAGHGKLMLDEAVLEAGAVVALPRLEGVRMAGVPAGFSGFVETDGSGAVPGLEDVHVVGDQSAYPVKQGGVAAQAADDVALVLAAKAGAGVEGEPRGRTLRVRLAGTAPPLFFTVSLDAYGRPLPGTSEVSEGSAPWWPPAKVHARHLAGYLAAHEVEFEEAAV